VRDQAAALNEIGRVLRPGGQLVFVEHVAGPPGSWLRRWQRLAAPVSRLIDKGCDPARDTGAAIDKAPFTLVEKETFWRPTGLGMAVPFIAGYARR
jgi:SAM-dependent methyltransferase